MKRTRLRRKSKNPVAKLKWLADRAFSDWIRNRDNWVCFTCEKRFTDRARMHAGHFRSRVYTGTRYDERNVHAQCAMCNVWKRGDYAVYAVKLQKQYGQGILQELIDKSRVVTRFGAKEYQAIIEKYR